MTHIAEHMSIYVAAAGQAIAATSMWHFDPRRPDDVTVKLRFDHVEATRVFPRATLIDGMTGPAVCGAVMVAPRCGDLGAITVSAVDDTDAPAATLLVPRSGLSYFLRRTLGVAPRNTAVGRAS